jgi:hypothetical protein
VARSAYRVLRAIFNTAIQDDLMIKSPCRVKGAGTDRSAERTVPTVEQVALLTLAMPEQYRAAVVLAAWGTLAVVKCWGSDARTSMSSPARSGWSGRCTSTTIDHSRSVRPRTAIHGMSICPVA